MENPRYPFVNLPLPYPANGLEPFLDEKTMLLHHDKHLQAYINNLNGILAQQPPLQALTLEQLICSWSLFPKAIGEKIRNNAGGVYNHRLYFSLLTNPAQREPQGALRALLDRDFGGYESFRAAFQKAAMDVFGSGYAWLVLRDGRLSIVTTPNQDVPLDDQTRPILLIDVWEHAYYLKHFNLRADYVADWFQIINWEQAQRNLEPGGAPEGLCPSELYPEAARGGLPPRS